MIPMFKFLCTDKGQHKVRTLGTIASVPDFPNQQDGIDLLEGKTRFSIAANRYVRNETLSATRDNLTGSFTFICPTCGRELRRGSAKTAEIITKLSALGVSSVDVSFLR